MTFPLFRNISNIFPEGTIGISELIMALKSPAMQQCISTLRNIKDKTAWEEYKMQLPNVCFNANLSLRGKNIIMTSDGKMVTQNLLCYNQITALDFDHIPAVDMKAFRQRLISDPYAYLVYTTPSGHGLKMLVRHDNTDPLVHAWLYVQLLELFRGYSYIDKCVGDLSRVSYLSYDPDVFYNPNSLVFHYDATDACHDRAEEPATVKPAPSQPTPKDSPMTNEMVLLNRMLQYWWKDKALMDYIDKYQWSHHPEDYQEGNRNNSLLRKAAQLYACGVHYDFALWKLTYLYTHRSNAPFNESEIASRVYYAYTHGQVPFGSKRKEWEDAKRQRMENYKIRQI